MPAEVARGMRKCTASTHSEPTRPPPPKTAGRGNDFAFSN